MSNARSRADWVDCARTLAMFFIIWLHAAAAPAWSGKVVGGGIALFFMMAGYFLPSVAGKVLVRTGRLALAWAAWSLLSVAFLLLAKPYVEISWERAIGWGVAAYNTPLWFLKTLVAYQLVVALLLWLKALPRYSWVLVVFLAFCSYTTAPSQHLSVRFDYFWIFLLGYSAKVVSLEMIFEYIRRHGWVLLLVVHGVFFQPGLLEDLADMADLSWRHCNLPLWNLSFMTMFLLAGVALAVSLPRVSGALASCGQWMLFIYAGHSYLLTPIYCFENLRWGWNLWVPVLLLPLMVVLARWLNRLLPRTMAVLQAKPW